MTESDIFAVYVFRIVCERLQAKAADIRVIVQTNSSFEEWLNWEELLACNQHQESYPFLS